MADEGGEILHEPVLLQEVLLYLNPRPGESFLDCTVGAAGHSLAIIEAIGPEGQLIGIDRDEEILNVANKKLKQYSPRYRLFHANYSDLDAVLDEAEMKAVDGIIFDLGVSSHFQLDSAERGFAFSHEAPLDMRMDRSQKQTAEDIVNRLPADNLERIFREYGEERWARRIARRIVSERKESRIHTTTDLVKIVESAAPTRERQKHVATRVFQALRIAVNDEFNHLERGLDRAISRLSPGGRIAAISFHSLEDRIVKNAFRTAAKNGLCEVLTKKPVTATEGEMARNRRCRSAKLRAAKRRA